MSNYFFVFTAGGRTNEKLYAWRDKYRDPELRETSVAHGMTVFSHDLPNSFDSETRTFFKGHMVDHRAGSVVFGLKGWKRYRNEHAATDYAKEGQFLHVSVDKEVATFRRDAFGMLPLLYTEGSGYVAVSDSMVALVDFREHMGDAVTPHEEVLLSRALLGVYGGQQLSPDTYVEQISFVPGRQTLSVKLGNSALPTARDTMPVPYVTGKALDGLHLEDGETYQDGLRTGAENIARTMATLANLGQWKPALSLSGGYDSRVPLAGAIASGTADQLNLNTKNTQPIHAEDFGIATEIAEKFGLNLNGKSTAGVLKERKYDATPFQMWAMADLGMYDYITRPKAARNPRKHIQLTGLGGEVMRGNYNWQPWAQIIGSLVDPNPLVASALYRQGIKGLEAIGADPTTRQSSELHYMNYRYALHGGTGRPLHMMSFVPLIQTKLVALAHSPANEFPYPTHYEPSIVNDLCIVLVPELAKIRYDKGKPGRRSKDLPPEYVAARLAHLGGPIDTSALKPYKVYGTPDDVPAGPSEFMLALSRKRGLDLPMTSDVLLDLGKKGLDVLDPGPVRDIYEKVYANGKWRLETKKYPITGAAKDSPTKAVILHALFGG